MKKLINQGEEKALSKDGVIATTLVHLILLLLFFFFGLTAPWPKQEEQGILINFGTMEQGSGEVQPVAETVPQPKTQESVSSPSAASASKTSRQKPKPIIDNKVVTTKNKKAPALPVKEPVKKKDTKKVEKAPKKVATKDQPKKKQPEKQPKKDVKKAKEPVKTKKDVKKATEPVKKKKPTVDENALFPGSKKNSSKGQGNTNKDGDLGNKMGKVDISDNKGNKSPGLGKSGVGFDLSGRRLMSIPPVRDNSQEIGTVVIKIKVDKSGKVIDAQYTSAGSTNPTLRNKALAAARKAKFNPVVDGPAIQSGTMTFNFKLM